LSAAARSFSPDHPAAQGHFPGNPMIPGALLLSAVLQEISAGLGVDLASCRVRSAKFLAPVRPGDHFSIEYSRSGGGAVRFDCRIGGRTVLRGELACDAIPQAT
jgi:3-hydroxymyristoyl/3-hydroxydecanoyl-(acyl carrier protein) dehydratase